MMNMTCEHCGAGLIAGARFCRNCGQPAAAAQGRSVTEATTQIFDAPMRTANDPFASDRFAPHAAPLVAPDASTTAQRTSPTQRLGSSSNNSNAQSQRRNLWLIIAGGGVCVIILAALLIVGAALRTSRVHAPRVVVAPPAIPAAPPMMPPAVVVGAAQPSIAQEMFYPGAKVEQTIVSSEDGQVVRLHSSDKFDKVVSWYETKFKPTEKVIIPDAQAVLKIKNSAVIISTDGNGTSIMLTEDTD